MLDHQDANPLLDALRHRRKLALEVFFGVIAACGAGAFLTLQYSASAIVALNPQAAVNPNGQPRSAVEIAWSSLPDKQIEALIEQFHLDTGTTRLFAQSQIFTYVRSRISLHQMESGGSAPEVAVSYQGPDRSTVVELTNALAQSLVEAKSSAQSALLPGGGVTTIAGELEKSRRELQLLSEGQNTEAFQAQLQEHFKVDGELQAEQRAIDLKLSALAQERQREELAAFKASSRPPPPAAPNPVRLALQQQVIEARNHLTQLRQRYTEEYPDVIDARNALAQLQARLNRIPPDKPPPPPKATAGLSPTEEARIAAQEAALQDSQADVQKKIQSNREQAEVVRQRIADGKRFAEDYALEQAHYNALLKAQETGVASASGGNAQQAPLFLIVQSATREDAVGIAVKPLFWVLSLLAAVLAALIAAYFAEQLDPVIDEHTASRSLHPS